MKIPTAEWVQRAEEDYFVAQSLVSSPRPTPNTICFCCQQCIEKYLKALLDEEGIKVPRTHDLEYLLSLLAPTYPSLAAFRRGCKFLSQFAVHARYPGFKAKLRQAASSLRWAERLRQQCRDLLGIKPPKLRKK